ncbi:MAG: hypothetical protein KBD39_09185 [Sterolibacterium sp.]|nr:hypothetical protein [Sterolibacterium sp.]
MTTLTHDAVYPYLPFVPQPVALFSAELHRPAPWSQQIEQTPSDLLSWSHNVFEFLKVHESWQYLCGAFVLRAIAQFLDRLKSQKASGFLRKLHALHPEFVPQPVGQRTTSISYLWSVKQELRSTNEFVAHRRSTKLGGVV